MSRLFLDCDRKLVTESQILESFCQNLKETPEEYQDMTFLQYIDLCLTRNNGQLDEIRVKQKAREFADLLRSDPDRWIGLTFSEFLTNPNYAEDDRYQSAVPIADKMFADMFSGTTGTGREFLEGFLAVFKAEPTEWLYMDFNEWLSQPGIEEVPERDYEIEVERYMIARFRTKIWAYSRDEAEKKYREANDNSDYWEEWDDAVAQAEVTGENIAIKEG